MKNFNLTNALAETQAIHRKLSALAVGFQDSETVNGRRIAGNIQRECEEVSLAVSEAIADVTNIVSTFEALREVAPIPKADLNRANTRRFGPAKIHKELSFGRCAYQEDDFLGLAWLAALESRHVDLGLPESLEDGAWDVAIADAASKAVRRAPTLQPTTNPAT